MCKKIYISPSSQEANTYAVGNTNEAQQCREIAEGLRLALVRCGFQARADTRKGIDMYRRVAQSNIWKADLHICIHTNAFNGEMMGTKVFCLQKEGEGGRAAQAILEALGPRTPGREDELREAKFYEITATHAPCAYVEVGFHDHPTEAQWILDHKDDIAEAICQGICRYYGVEYRSAEVIYRVQVGAFHREEYAQKLREDLKKAGFPGAWIRKEEAS